MISQTAIIFGLYLIIIQFHLTLVFVLHQQQAPLAIILELIFQHQNGTKIYSVSSGVVSFLGFQGANGYTIQITNNETIFSYSHISPKFIIKIGDFINKNQLIATVGPKYINTIANNPYQDFSRSANERSNNWLSFTF